MSDKCPRCGAAEAWRHSLAISWECQSQLCEGEFCQVPLCRIRELEAALAVVHEHRIKTRKVADERLRNVGQDGLTIQLQSEATLMDVLCPTDVGKQIAERLIKLEATVAERDATIAELEKDAEYLRSQVVSGTKSRDTMYVTITSLRECLKIALLDPLHPTTRAIIQRRLEVSE